MIGFYNIFIYYFFYNKGLLNFYKSSFLFEFIIDHKFT